MTNLAPTQSGFEVLRPKEPVIKPLSERELQVLQWYCNGKGTKDIAAILDISVKTVETHRAHLFQKLNSEPGIMNLVLAAMKRGIVIVQ